jgi:hypothetical protein
MSSQNCHEFAPVLKQLEQELHLSNGDRLRILRIEIHAPYIFFYHEHLEPSTGVCTYVIFESLFKMRTERRESSSHSPQRRGLR